MVTSTGVAFGVSALAAPPEIRTATRWPAANWWWFARPGIVTHADLPTVASRLAVKN